MDSIKDIFGQTFGGRSSRNSNKRDGLPFEMIAGSGADGLLELLEALGGGDCGNPDCPIHGGGASREDQSTDWRKLAARLDAVGRLYSKVVRTATPEVNKLVGSEVFKRLEAEARGGSLHDQVVKELGALTTGKHDAEALNEQTVADVQPYLNALLAAKGDDDAMKARAKGFMRSIYRVPGFSLRLSTVHDIIAYVAGENPAQPELPNELAYEERLVSRFDEVTSFLRGRGEEPVPPAFIIEAYQSTTSLAELIAKHFPEPVATEPVEEPIPELDEAATATQTASGGC